ncbi:hypothetical protein ACFX11_006790 [Malus domestica]
MASTKSSFLAYPLTSAFHWNKFFLFSPSKTERESKGEPHIAYMVMMRVLRTKSQLKTVDADTKLWTLRPVSMSLWRPQACNKAPMASFPCWELETAS